ncbi:MAG: hypothetical protein CVV50_00475 [Spirochaetae bacterium HGW-Spirochaetae-6]|nr:MAG: hypothetical protein CVV50_00475 [Spirochaetae bacterium HGW-Spirochaetae-6]
MKKIYSVLSSFLFLFPVLSGAQQGIEGKTLKVGSFLPLSGPVAFIGRGVRQGMDTFIKYFNQELKTGGYTLESYFLDDGYDSVKSLSIVRDLTENKKVFALVGAVGTPGILGSLDYIRRTGMPFVYQGSGVTPLHNPPSRNIFPVQPSYEAEGRVFGNFIVNHLKLQKVVYVFQRDIGVVEAAEGALRGLYEMAGRYRGKGLQVVSSIPFSSTDADLSPVVHRIKQLGPDAVVVFAFGEAVLELVKAARQGGMNLKQTPFITTYANSDPIFFRMAGGVWNDIYVGAWVKPAESESYENFVRIWKKHADVSRGPSFYNIAGWMAMEVFAEGLARTVKNFPELNWRNFIAAMETFHEDGGWSGGLSYKLSYTRCNGYDQKCRYPQNYQYFIVGVEGRYQLYKKTANLNELYISAD